MANLSVNRRPHGAVKKTTEELQDAPIPRRQPQGGAPLAVPQRQAQSNEVNGDYGLDPRATNPYASMSVDVQAKAQRAKMWFEIAAHPGATDFERKLAEAHFDEMEPDEIREQREAEEEKQAKEAETKDTPKTKKEDK